MNKTDAILAIKEAADFLYWNQKLNQEEVDYLKKSMLLLRKVTSLNDKQ